jgi:hypothetical protein
MFFVFMFIILYEPLPKNLEFFNIRYYLWNFMCKNLKNPYSIHSLLKKNLKFYRLIKKQDQKLWLKIFEGPKFTELFIGIKNKI